MFPDPADFATFCDPGRGRRRTNCMAFVLTAPIPIGTLSWPKTGAGPVRPARNREEAESRHVAREPEIRLTDATDEALFARYRDGGDREALRVLIDRYRDELLAFLTRFLGNRAAAEDVFQETFLQIHVAAASFDVDRRFKPWLFTIAANKGRDHHRKHARRQTVSLSRAISNEDEGRQFVDLLEADMPQPDAPALENELGDRVRSIVDGMPRHLREILLLNYFQRMSYNQIADSLSIPLGTVKSRLHAAVATFARAWAAADGEEEDQ